MAETNERSMFDLKQTAHYVLDFRETITSLALLKMTQVLREMETDEILEIVIRDPDARTDVLKVIPASFCELIKIEFNEDADLCRMHLRKTRRFGP
jgi:TusA-related sulfurtransferase